MVDIVKLKNLDTISSGSKRYRRRIPKDIQEILGEKFFQRGLKSKEGDDLILEHAACVEEFKYMVAQARSVLSKTPVKLPSAPTAREKWESVLRGRSSYLEGVQGLEPEVDEEGNEYDYVGLLETVSETVTDPLLAKAIVAPNSPTPEPSLRDALNLYKQEKVGDDRRKLVRTDGIFAQVFAALEVDDVLLSKITRPVTRQIRDYMKGVEKYGGGKRSITTISREISIVKAVVAFGFREFEIERSNPFSEMVLGESVAMRADERRLPLSEDIIKQMNERLMNGSNDSLVQIWTILTGTGARLAEISGLAVADVIIEHDFPHIRIRPNDYRRLKTTSSIRLVPLMGIALVAAKAALKAAPDGGALFPRYASERGPDAVSAILSKTIRKVTSDKRHTTHSLRHSFKDNMRLKTIPKEVQDNILGHSSGAVGENTYGSQLAKLEVAHQWMSEVYKADNPDSYYRSSN